MESSIAEFLKRKLACELLPTSMLSGVVLGGHAMCCVACGVNDASDHKQPYLHRAAVQEPCLPYRLPCGIRRCVAALPRF